MKKIVFSLGLCLCVGFTALGQDIVVIDEAADNAAFVNKRGIALLPKAGDFAIGIEATPFLQYLGNFFNQSGNNKAPSFEGRDYSVYGKYFLEDDRAIRAKLTLNIGNTSEKGVVPNDHERANNPLNANATVVDVAKFNSVGVMLGAGYEFRRGRGRVQGFYGGEVLLCYEGSKDKYEYANPMTAVNQDPSTWDFVTSTPINPTNRAVEIKGGKTFKGGVAAFAGVEYFFAPQISIGGELNVNVLYAVTGQTEITSESWDASANQVQTQTLRGGSWTAPKVGLYTRPSASIFLMFHF